MIKKILPFIIIVVAILLTAVMVRNRPDAEQNEPTEIAILVDTITATPRDTYIEVASQGTVEPRTRTNLVSEVTGQVVEISPSFVAGGFFRKGDVLLKLDDRNYQAAVSRNEATVAAARSQLAQERGQADVAQRQWELMTEDQRMGIKAKELYLRKPQLEEATARLASAEADLQQAKTDLEKTVAIAPYDGLVSVKNTDIGQFITTGASIAEIFAVDKAEVRLPIPENKLPYLELPDAMGNSNSQQLPVELISVIGDNENRWQGRLARTEGVLDTRTRVLFSVVEVEDPYGLYSDYNTEPLRIGTFVNASVRGKLLENVFVLPRHTLQANNLVWVSDMENRLRTRTVDVITINGDNVYITKGIQPGDKVVLTRLENPLNGTLVQSNELDALSQLSPQ